MSAASFGRVCLLSGVAAVAVSAAAPAPALGIARRADVVVHDVSGVRIASLNANQQGSIIDCGYNGGLRCTASLQVGTVVVLQASDAKFTTFTSWGGDCAPARSNRQCRLVITSSKSVTANWR